VRAGTDILFLREAGEDYLADAVLHGLRELLGARVVDFPKAEALYLNCPDLSFARVRGHGFTLYRTLPDEPVDRWDVINRLKLGQFGLVIFGSIQRQYAQFVDLLPWLDPARTVVLDGEDTPAIAPFAGRWWRRPTTWLWPAAHTRFAYYKREWLPATLHYRCYRLWPEAWSAGAHERLQLRRIGFSIPAAKIFAGEAVKTKDFPAHIVDAELAARLPGAGGGYKFTTEAEYYADLRSARFGITTKRAGWDCLRHYEIAVNGAVPCFRDLALKPASCAPHGLHEGNSLSYGSAEELLTKIASLDASAYARLRAGALAWARENSTQAMAARLLAELGVSATPISP
jgi:hypothetical protein